MTSGILTTRQLNRTLLARQLLLERSTMSSSDAVHHLVGMQAQIPLDPYLALWSRLDGFDPHELGQLLADRRVVRTTVMRATIHLVTAEDALVLRPLMQPVVEPGLVRHAEHGPHLADVDLAPVLDFAETQLRASPLTGPQLRDALTTRFPEMNAAALAWACRTKLALVQVPPRGVWGQTLPVTWALTEHWLGRPLAANPSLDDVVLRYLAAFGPATPADVTAWSRLTGLKAVLERLRPQLRTFRDEQGRELFDVPDAPMVVGDVAAPTRFFPTYDNLVLAHADRTRVISDELRRQLFDVQRQVHGAVAHDGFICGTWTIERSSRRRDAAVTLIVTSPQTLPKRTVRDLEAEGLAALAFLEPDAADLDVRIQQPA